MYAYLNTYHVMVQPELDQLKIRNIVEFKYISCYGSTRKNVVLHAIIRYLNTYHVMVQRCNASGDAIDFII